MAVTVFAKFVRRRRCHGSIACCQYVDKPMCNSYNDPHLLWRLVRRRRPRRIARAEGW